jgi:hypothetical protein
MSGNDAVVWFVATTLAVFGMLAFGTYLAMHSYDRGRGVVDFHLWHRHR